MNKNQTVKVGIRIRPLNRRETQLQSPVCVESKDNVLTIKKQKDAKNFVFDYVFGIDSRQESIYQACAYSLVENGLEGYNGTIFAYGQTGAGKTFTMVGDYKDPEVKGIIPRTFDHVITAIKTSEEKQYVVRASFIEIYNEDIMDLLEEKKKNQSAKKDLKQSPDKGVFIKDLKMVPVKSVDQLFQILDLGNKNRTVHATAMNAVSSRSHALFTVHIQSLEGKDKIKASKINLVDLAGSQRQSKTEATGDRLKEGAKINLSLTALGNVINALVDGKKGGHIPYRDSKLTRMLQDSLGGNTKTLMIASVSPAQDNYDETVSTLRYAARARNIKNTPKINEDPKDAMIRQYLQEIQNLKKQLTSQGISPGQNMQGLSAEEQQEYKRKVEEAAQQARKAQQQAAQKSEQLNQKEQEIRMMQQKLKDMEELVLKKGEVSPQILKVQKLKKKKIMKQEQLVEQRLVELAEAENQLLDEDKQNSEDQKMEGKNTEEKAQYWKNLVGKLRNKLKSVIKDKDDIQKEFQTERQDLNKTIRNMEGDLSFYSQLAAKFISENQILILKENSEYDEEKREYTLPPFMMHEEALTLPKTLKKHEVDDLWKEKRKGIKMQLLKDLPQISSPSKSQAKRMTYVEPKGSPFIESRRIFKISDYTDPKYQEKQYNINNHEHIFRRTNFRINDRDSRSKSRSNSKQSKNILNSELQSLNRPISRSKEETLRPTSSRSKGKDKLAPIQRP